MSGLPPELIMTQYLPRFAARPFPWLGMFAVPLVVLAVACDPGTPQRTGKVSPVTSPAPLVSAPDGTRLSFKASISRVETNWRDGQQTFVLTLTNTGEALVTVHAIIYGRNEDIQPPRRAISPPTASDWFALAESTDGQLGPQDIEKHWKDNGFIGARGSKMKVSWDVTVPPGATKTIDASHQLDEISPFPASKGKRLTRLGFTEYRIWLFSSDGRFFLEQVEKAVKGNVVDAPNRPDTGKRTNDPATLAADALSVAQYHLKTGKAAEARRELQEIIDKFPQTESARTARKLLKELKAN